MSISEEELQKWEARVSKLGSGLFYGESLRLIQEVRELNDQLNYERMEAYRLDKKIGEIKSQANAAEHHEKVAMRALANAIAAWNGEDFPPNMSTSPLEPWLEQAEKELQ